MIWTWKNFELKFSMIPRVCLKIMKQSEFTLLSSYCEQSKFGVPSTREGLENRSKTKLLNYDNAPDKVKLSPFLRALHQLRSFSQNSFFQSLTSLFSQTIIIYIWFFTDHFINNYLHILVPKFEFFNFRHFCQNYIMITVLEIFTNLPRII